MKLPFIITLAFKYLLRYRRRYLFLITALAVGVCIVSVIVSQKDGMSANVYATAQSHYAGDIVFYGRDADSERGDHLDFGTVSAIVKAIDDSGIRYTSVAKRTVLYSQERLYYNGVSVALKYTTGIDWGTESDYLNSLSWTEGGYDAPSDDTIFISAPIAALLGAVRGDSLLLETVTRYGQKNTHDFIIGGIINDSSIFGYYKVYVSRRLINTLVEFGEEDCSHLGVFLPPKASIEAARKAVYEQLQGKVDLAALVYNRDEWDVEKDKSWKGIRVFPLTLGVYLSEVSQILEALNLLTYFLYAIMLLIIFVSAAVTYRLILHERTRELGTMRALGFKNAGLRLVLALETVFAATVSIIAGVAVSFAVNKALSYMSWNWMPSFEIFMKNGSLTARYGAASIAFNACAVYAALLAAVWFPANTAVKTNLPEMLAAGAKG